MENFQQNLNSYSNTFTCLLSDSDLQQRKSDAQKNVFSKVVKTEELDNGYVFYFEDKDDIDEQLTFYLLAEKRCCSFFQLDLSVKPNHSGIAFTISGAPGAKTFLKSMIGDIISD